MRDPATARRSATANEDLLRMRRHACPALHRFRRDERGSLLVWFALALIPLLYAVGAGIDYGRSVNFKAQLQGAADAAALAGASAYVDSSGASTATSVATTYMNNFVAAMGSSYGITYAVSTTAKSSGSSATMYGVTVTASGKIKNTVMALSTPTNTVGVKATAANPVYTMTLTLSSYSSSAADANTIYYYIVPANGGTPDSFAMTKFFSNDGSNSTPSVTLQLTASQKVGFMLQNVTGGLSYYATNGYGGTYKSTHLFYSHLFPPSSIAYPNIAQNCSLQVASGSGAATSGSCFASDFPYSAVNCAAASGKTLTYSWNDMGGTGDDKDYNDMVYKVTCSQNDAGNASGVVLTN
jgi:Flp pilus assembly protein TadG